MINPVDQSTVKAMVEYRQQQLTYDIECTQYEPDPRMSYATLRWVHPVRRAIGLRIMRTGARLAGIGIYPRAGTQL